MTERRRTIRVRVVLSVEVDIDLYRENYGHESLPTIRYDVRHAIADSARTGGVIAEGITAVDVLDADQ